jgi:hypothetical protein
MGKERDKNQTSFSKKKASFGKKLQNTAFAAAARAFVCST